MEGAIQSGWRTSKIASAMPIISMFTYEWIEDWKTVLGIPEWNIVCTIIDEEQVVDSLLDNSHGHEFVGIERDFTNRSGIIYCTRTLEEDDIIHELLHVRYPEWSENKVEFWTSLLNGEPILQRAGAMQYLLPAG